MQQESIGKRSLGNLKTMGETASGGNTSELSLGNLDTASGGHAGGSLGTIDRYDLLRELGGGGFGTVYLAHDTVAGIEVAVKGLPPLMKHNLEELERIRANFALVSKLHHPNIAAALHLHRADKVIYHDERTRQALRVMPGDTMLVMAYAPGVTLSKWRRQFPGGRVPPTTALDICSQIAAALDYAHSEKIIHRDIKPSNIMVESKALSGSPQVRVLDFGLAAEIRSSMSRISQEQGDTSGTRPYMAPEQWAGRRQDGRTDQYALAVLFYELVSGVVPFASAFDTGDPVIMANAAQQSVAEPLPELSRQQNRALLRALAKEPTLRFASCGAFMASLAGKAMPRHRVMEGAPGASRLKRVALFAVLIAALAAASATSIWSIRSRNARVEQERLASAEAAAQDAALREKVAQLKTAAESALAAGDLEAVGARIAELEQLGGTSVASSDLRRQYETKAQEEINKRHAEAAARRGEAEKARGEAVGENAEKDARELFESAGQAFARATESFEKGDFQAASKGWQAAKEEYGHARTRAQEVQAYHKAKGDFATALKLDEALLTKHGGDKWQEVQREQRIGAASVNDPVEGERAYRAALAALPAAVQEAKGAQLAEAERLSLEKREREERERQNKITVAIAAAKGAKERGKWQECLDQAEEVLKLDRNSIAALALKQEAERELVPRLTINVVDEAGKVVTATISDGKNEWLSGTELPLVVGQTYAFAITASASSSPRGYMPETLRLTAGWRGPQTRRVALKAIKEPQAGETQTVDLGGGVKLELVWCPPGSFMMGSPTSEAERYDNETQHRVTLTKGFWLGKYEVTQGQWEAVMGSNPSHFKNAGKNAPVERVSWDDCQEFVRKLNARVSGGGFRLPTEAEWESACRAGTATPFHYGDSLDATMANFDGNYPYGGGRKGEYRQRTLPVGSFRPNAWGLYDMHGNVWEWCQDWYGGYSSGNVTDPAGPGSGAYRVYRGGSCYSFARSCRSADRSRGSPAPRDLIWGLRLARSPQ